MIYLTGKIIETTYEIKSNYNIEYNKIIKKFEGEDVKIETEFDTIQKILKVKIKRVENAGKTNCVTASLVIIIKSFLLFANQFSINFNRLGRFQLIQVGCVRGDVFFCFELRRIMVIINTCP